MIQVTGCVGAKLTPTPAISSLLNMQSEITVNGEKRSVPEGQTLAELVQELDLEGRRVAVEVNEEIVPRSRYAEHVLNGGDRVEVVAAIGGG